MQKLVKGTFVGLGLCLCTIALIGCFFRLLGPQHIDTLSESFGAEYGTFVSAQDDRIQYNGRWLSAPNQQGMEASFGGSNLDFTVSNTSNVFIFLSNRSRRSRSINDEFRKGARTSLLLTPAQTRSEPADPVELFVAINSTLFTYYDCASGPEVLAEGLDLNSLHDIRVQLPLSQEPNTVQVRGLFLDKGGILFHHSATIGRAIQPNRDFGGNRTESPPISADSGSISRRFVEIVAPISMLTEVCRPSDSKTRDCEGKISWLDLIDNHFANTGLSVLPLANPTCMTQQCQNHQSGTPSETASAQDTFFRAGSPGTLLYDRLWPFGYTKDIPTALVLMLGLPDVEAFLIAGWPTKHQIAQLTDDLARTYSSFIQTIRRTAYSPASTANRQASRQITLENDVDESYLYNSSPSTIPIFLVLHPLPSLRLHLKSRQLNSLLHLGTSKVLNELKWHIGDKHTFVINTDGWLNDADFQSFSSFAKHDRPKFSLKQSGHIKFAHHMSLHLCHYLVDRDPNTSECPFDRHDEYTGNLYVPEAAEIGKLLEEKKIAKIKEIYGVE